MTAARGIRHSCTKLHLVDEPGLGAHDQSYYRDHRKKLGILD